MDKLFTKMEISIKMYSIEFKVAQWKIVREYYEIEVYWYGLRENFIGFSLDITRSRGCCAFERDIVGWYE